MLDHRGYRDDLGGAHLRSGCLQLVVAGIEAVYAELVGHGAAGGNPGETLVGRPPCSARTPTAGAGEQWLLIGKSDGCARPGRDAGELPRSGNSGPRLIIPEQARRLPSRRA